VSDPGEELVRAWADLGGTVVPIPGASAVLAAVAASGVAGPRWTFEGFLPRSGRARRERLARIAADERGCVVYEAPGRAAGTLADLAASCGPDRPGAVCRELTKLHEEIVRDTLAGLAERARSGAIAARGEFVLVVGERVRSVAGGAGAEVAAAEGTASAAATAPSGGLDALTEARAEVERLVAEGAARGDAARRVARATGLSRRRLYGSPGEGGTS
jgi:16S rRNA (cytidine1402-2'-O)-methyltransferase